MSKSKLPDRPLTLAELKDVKRELKAAGVKPPKDLRCVVMPSSMTERLLPASLAAEVRDVAGLCNGGFPNREKLRQLSREEPTTSFSDWWIDPYVGRRTKR